MRGRSGRVEDNALTRMPKCVGVVDPSREWILWEWIYPKNARRMDCAVQSSRTQNRTQNRAKRHNVAKGRDVFSLFHC